MLIGYFDYFVITLITLLNIKYWKVPVSPEIGCILFLIVYCFILPIVSIIIELGINGPKKGELSDSFNYVYVYLRFPIYWILYILQGISFLIKPQKINLENDTNSL